MQAADVPIPELPPLRSTRAAGLERIGAATCAAALLALGLSRRSLGGTSFALAALPFAYRALMGEWPSVFRSEVSGEVSTTRRAVAGDRGIHVRDAVRLERPRAEVYRFWRRLENLPTFMSSLERVTDLGNGRSRWIAKAPAGRRVEWEAEITDEVENEVINWRSLPGADVASAGSVRFDEVRGGRSTQVTVHLQYAPPAGRLGAYAALAAGREPSQTIREDLRRLKQLLEAGEIARTAPPTSQEVR
jgi:uncharacterized membrane protein